MYDIVFSIAVSIYNINIQYITVDDVNQTQETIKLQFTFSQNN
jgi:hypothetical protein